MTKPNILYIMCDQLRFDYLGCYGHPYLKTPNIDALAAGGTRFTRAYVQSPICGPSRMSSYTGRYMSTHGSLSNGYPLRVGEMTMGDYLRPLGMDTVLIGKTHMNPDEESMERYGIPRDSIIGARLSECGFDVFERDDGLHPSTNYDPDPTYNAHLAQKGYDTDNPWETHANGVAPLKDDETGNGWFLKYSDRPALVAEPDSETPYLVRRFMDFLDGRDKDDAPWCCHLSFIKPHWPYIVPAPYNDMYGPDAWVPPVRDDAEKIDPNPVFGAFMQHRVSQSFSRDNVRNTVLPAYMGLIKQIDDQMGVLFQDLKDRGLWDDTVIVFTSDHGDYLGDHWLGDKDLFHEPSVKVPLIIRDPREGAAAGQVRDDLVESIDILPTFLDMVGGASEPHRLEGRSLVPILQGDTPEDWRKVAFSEYDYATQPARNILGRSVSNCKLIMACTKRWKMIYCDDLPPMLFDLENDPKELIDLGRDPTKKLLRDRMTDEIFAWSRRENMRTTMANANITSDEGATVDEGILIGFWDEAELESFMQGRNDTASD